MINIKELLFELCACNGVSGKEINVSAKACAMLNKFMPSYVDNTGNVIGKKDGKGVKILLDAHIDEIGLIVTAIDKEGFLRVARCGGADARVMSASEVIVHGKKDVYGVISSIPPHLSDKSQENKAADFDNIYIDIGMSYETASKLIKPGDRISFKGSQCELLNNCVCSPCIDNRAGMVVILRCLEILYEKNADLNLQVMFSAQEETGGSGAITGSFECEASEAIVTDVGFARAPGIKNEEAAVLGNGVMIGFSPSLDNNMSNDMVNIAQNNNIKWQYDVMGGNTGTNCDDISISSGGIKTALLSVPIRNMHTCIEVVCIDDIESAARLMAAYILERSI